MGPLRYVAALVGLLVLEANAMAIAEPTKRLVFAHRDSIPAPTQLAQLFASIREHGHLEKRADETTNGATVITTFTATIATDKTCGYVSASAGNPITCTNGKVCVWEEEHLNGIMCGIDSDAEIKNVCIDRERAANTDLCDDLCQSNAYNLFCTDKTAAYCRTYVYPNGVADYRCASTRVLSLQSVAHTYSGQKYSGFTTTTFAELVENQSTSFAFKSSSTEGESATTTEAEPAVTTTSDPDPPKEKSTNLGAIIGGAIGGFVALAAVVIAIIWLLRRNKKNAASTPPPPPPQQVQPGQSMQQTWIDPNSPDKSRMTSPVQSEWRQSTMTAPVSSVSPGTVHGWDGQPTTPQFGYQGHQPGTIAEMGSERMQATPVEMDADPVRR